MMAVMCVSAMAQKITVSGYITDAKSGESLIGEGEVYNNPTPGTPLVGAVSNNYGFYTLSLPAGQRSLTWSFLGYKDLEQTLDLTRDTVINVRLEPGSQLKAAAPTAISSKEMTSGSYKPRKCSAARS